MPDIVNIPEKFGLFHDHWRPKVVGRLNGQELKLVKVKGEFPWHTHADADEMFLVLLGPGEFIIVPRGIEHRTAAEEEEAEVLIFEPSGVRNTGDIIDDTFTAPQGAEI